MDDTAAPHREHVKPMANVLRPWEARRLGQAAAGVWTAFASRLIHWTHFSGIKAKGRLAAGPLILNKPDRDYVNPTIVTGTIAVMWSTRGVEAAEIRVGSPSGPLFAEIKPGRRGVKTAPWMAGSTSFFLQDISGGKALGAENTLAKLEVEIQASFSYRARELRHRARQWIGRPVFEYFVFHLTDHCNLNCKGCGHFSPLAGPWFADLEVMRADFERLSRLFRKIEMVRLMGGEPLLHPRLAEALTVARQYLPRTHLRLVTNGTLLSKMEESFWRACRENGIVIDVTLYPISLDADVLRGLAAQHGVPIEIGKCNHFFASLNLKGDSDPQAAMEKCRSEFFCPFLQDGKLYVCTIPATIHYFSSAFGTPIPSEGGIDIHDPRMTGRRVLELLQQPIPACRYCSTTWETFDWGISRKVRAEWEVKQPGTR